MISYADAIPPISHTHTVADFLDIVDMVVRKLSARLPAHVSREDLASVGKLALIRSLNALSGDLAEVRALCFVRVRGAVLDELRSNDVLSRHDRSLHGAIAKTRRQVARETGAEPSDSQIAAILQVDAARIARVQVRAAGYVHDADLSLVADPSGVSPANAGDTAELARILRTVIATLPKAQAHAVVRYHLEGATLGTIARELRVSIQRVQFLRVAGEAALRKALSAAWTAGELDP